MIDALVIEHIGRGLFHVSYNGAYLIVPWFRVDSAAVRVVREWHAANGFGR